MGGRNGFLQETEQEVKQEEETENYYITSLEDNRKTAVQLFDENNRSNVIENAIKFSF